jgi:formylglycine-generating enzyme required for sulfatase activity
MRKSLFFLGGIALTFLSACNFPTSSQTTPEITQATPLPSASIIPPTEQATDESAKAETELPKIQLTGAQSGQQMLWYDGAQLIFVPAGDFIMGTDKTDTSGVSANPEHKVTQSAFWIYRSEVTRSMYTACVAAGECSPPADSNWLPYDETMLASHPITGVSWEQAQSYCSWMQGHLPTEAQWEKTARGTNAQTYPWGEEAPSCELLNFNNCVGKTLPGGAFQSLTTPVQKYLSGASVYGALDMEGNVREWTQDWYAADYYAQSPANNPLGAAQGESKIVRGSSFDSNKEEVAAYLRQIHLPSETEETLGFRCVIDEPTYFAPLCRYSPPIEECPEPKLDVTDTYCHGHQGATEFDISENTEVEFSNAFCTEIASNHYLCLGADGGFAKIRLCHNCNNSEQLCEGVSCFFASSLDPETCECVFDIFNNGIIPTPTSEQENNGNGLIVFIHCPPGHYWDEGAQQCVPTIAFEEGILFNPDDFFRFWELPIPEEFTRCPLGWQYDQTQRCCQPQISLTPQNSTACAEYTLALGACETSQKQCVNPSQYHDQASCVAASCAWKASGTVTAQIYYCDYP